MYLLNDLDLDIALAELQNDMAEELAKHEEPLEIVLFGDNKAEHEGKWKNIGRSSQYLRNTEYRHSCLSSGSARNIYSTE